jgi:hypothetical protein
MQHAAHQKAFLPFPSDKGGEDFDRQTSGTVDMRGAADWRTVLPVDCGAYSWGQLAVSCEAIASPTVANALAVENWPWVEVRIVTTVGGIAVVYLEAGIGNHNSAVIGNDTKSSGPIFLTFGPGEVPDRIEVQARARRGGLAEVAGDADERLDLVASSRFRK